MYNIYKKQIDELTDDESDYLITLSFDRTNISNNLDDYILMIGFNPEFDKPRIKIYSKKSDKCFIILLDTLEIVGEYDHNVFDENIIERLKTWVKLNIKDLLHFSNDDEYNINPLNFVENLSKIK